MQLLKDTATSREEQSTLLLGDVSRSRREKLPYPSPQVEALRKKLEQRNAALESKEEQLERAARELAETRADVADRSDGVSVKKIR